MVESNISTRPFWEATFGEAITDNIFSSRLLPAGFRSKGFTFSTAFTAALAKCGAPALSMNSRERSHTFFPWKNMRIRPLAVTSATCVTSILS